MTLDNNISRIEAQVNGQQVPLRINTGAAMAPSRECYLNLTQNQARMLGLTGNPQMVFTTTGSGGEPLELPVFAVKSLHVADCGIPNAFAIVQPAVGYFARDDAVGFLGNSVLDKVDPWFDYAAGIFGVGA